MTEQAQPQVQVNTSESPLHVSDVYQIMRFVEELAKLGRLTTVEIDGIKPAFDRVGVFLQEWERMTATAPEGAIEKENDDLGLDQEEKPLPKPSQTKQPAKTNKQKAKPSKKKGS